MLPKPSAPAVLLDSMQLTAANLVIVGHWNVAILSPRWIIRHILELQEQDVKVMMAFAIEQRSPVSFTIESVTYQVQPTRLQISPSRSVWDEATLSNIEGIARAIVGHLPHTPIRAVGINFDFRVESEEIPDVQMFDIANDILTSVEIPDASITRTTIVKDIQLGGCVLKLTQSLSHGERMDLKFNYHYHYDVDSQIQLSELLDGTTLLGRKDITSQVVSRFFGVDPSDIKEGAGADAAEDEVLDG